MPLMALESLPRVRPGTRGRRARCLSASHIPLPHIATGMDMGRMAEVMPMPRNSIAMKGGAGPFGYIDMGGMFTIVKVRDHLENYETDPGWYQHPPDTMARQATPAELARDGIDVTVRTASATRIPSRT